MLGANRRRRACYRHLRHGYGGGRGGVRPDEHAEGWTPPTGLIRTIFAAINMLAFARVGGAPLDLVPEATGVGVGGRIGSIGASRDSLFNRRDDSGVRP